jgi:hypothetical protein
MGETRNAYRILVGKPEGKRPLGRPKRRWVDNIKMDLREIGWDDADWIELAQNRDQWRALVNTVMNLRVPKNCWEFPEWLHNWKLLRKGSAPYVSKYINVYAVLFMHVAHLQSLSLLLLLLFNHPNIITYYLHCFITSQFN